MDRSDWRDENRRAASYVAMEAQEPTSLYDALEERGWFCYHSDGWGDHYRKHGLAGIRATLFGSEGSIWKRAESGVYRGDWVRALNCAEDRAAFLAAADALAAGQPIETVT